MKKYIKSIDSLRVLSVLAVIVTHTTTRTLEAARFNLAGFPYAIFLNQIARFSVPLFIIISGFVLEVNTDEKIDIIYYFKRRFAKVAIPYIFWSLIYYYLIYTSNHDNLIKVFLTGNASYQLYFIPTLCIFYIMFPLLNKIYKFIANKYIVIGLLILQLVLLYHDYFIKPYRFSDPIRITLLSFFFFVAGMLAARNIEKINLFVHRFKYLLIPASILSGVYVFLEGFRGFVSTQNFWTYYETWRPSVLIYTILISLVLFHLFEKTKLQFSIIRKFSNLSFFVFFIHVAILEVMWSVVGKSLFNLIGSSLTGKIFFDPLFFALVTILSFGVAYILHKIPKLSKITG